MRINAPFAWLSVSGVPRRPLETVPPQSNGAEWNQKRYTLRASSESYRLSLTSIRASINAISESSVGCPASVPHVPPLASSRTPCGCLRQISCGVWNSTKPPKESPASWPSKHPWARDKVAGSGEGRMGIRHILQDRRSEVVLPKYTEMSDQF